MFQYKRGAGTPNSLILFNVPVPANFKVWGMEFNQKPEYRINYCAAQENFGAGTGTFFHNSLETLKVSVPVVFWSWNIRRLS